MLGEAVTDHATGQDSANLLLHQRVVGGGGRRGELVEVSDGVLGAFAAPAAGELRTLPDGAAFMEEQARRDHPAFVDLTDHCVGAESEAIEELFTELVAAIDLFDAAQRDTLGMDP